MKKKNLLMTAIAIFGLATITMAQVPNYVPTNGLVGWWPFNGNANDESGNGNNGTVSGATLTTDRFGNANKAYNFDGMNDFITAPKNYTFSNSITFNLWSNISSLSGVQTLFSSWGSNVNLRTFTIYYESQYYRNSIQTMNNQEYVFSNQTPLTGVWKMLTGTYDGNTLNIYENGQLISSTTTGSSNFNLNQYNFYNFGTEDQLTQFYNGKLDDIGIWNRALTQQEIIALYNGCQLSVNSQPANQTININNTAQFVVSSSDPSATYQWQTDLGVGFQNLNSVGQYSGTTNDTLIVSNVTMSNNNQQFRCIITSGSCSDTSNVAVLTVNNNVGINEVTQDNLFSVYPNPAKSQINVKADAILLGSIYTVYDNTGKLVLLGKIISENTTIELGNLSGGIYLFTVGENLKQTFKVIKE
jgi:hypothetical protein